MSCVDDKHVLKPGKKPGYERCANCTYQFPCPENTCGHGDCAEARGRTPSCHYCGKTVTGPKYELWTTWNVWGCSRTVHYSCRDEQKPEPEKVASGP